MRLAIFVLALLMSPMAGARAASPVEPAMNGTWTLDVPGAALYWALRDDGSYRLHGPGARPQQHGAAEAAGGRWSIKSPVWQDSGSYRLSDADTLQLTGALGTGTWKRVWAPSGTVVAPTAGAPICGLLSTDEVAKLLRAPVFVDAANPRLPGGCIFKSQLGQFDQLTMVSHRIGPQDFHLRRQRTDGPPKADLPGLREGGYAAVDGGGYLVGHILKGSEELIIRVKLTPDATLADAPYLAELARAAERRWIAGSGTAPASPIIGENRPPAQVGRDTQPRAAGVPPTGGGRTAPPSPSPPRPAAPIAKYQAPKLTDALTTQQYAHANQLYDNKRYDEALQAYLPPAERGDSRAQAMIGNIYYLRKPKEEHANALPWYEKAARQGNRQAEFFLGEMYGEGDGVVRDHKRSAQYYEAAALKGLKEAQAAIGVSYEFGYGVPRSRQTAMLWLNRAARNGNGAGGWLADWLSKPDTPHFANEDQLGAYINAKVGAWAASQMGGGGGYASSGSGSSGGGSTGGGCAYSSAAACNAAKAGDLWAADRIEQRRSNPSEKSWYDR